VEEVYSFRQITQYAAFTPENMAAINNALKALGIWQVCHTLVVLLHFDKLPPNS